LIFYDGIYRLRHKRSSRASLINQDAFAWRIRLIDFTLSQTEIVHLKPIAVIAKQIGRGVFKSSCAESLGRQICRDFSLQVDHILWVEIFQDKSDQFYVATFTPKRGPDYHISFRPIHQNELKAISRFVSDGLEFSDKIRKVKKK